MGELDLNAAILFAGATNREVRPEFSTFDGIPQRFEFFVDSRREIADFVDALGDADPYGTRVGGIREGSQPLKDEIKRFDALAGAFDRGD